MDCMATMDDWKYFGVLFGLETAAATNRNAAAGMTREANREHVAAMCRVKEAQLRAIGADAAELEAFGQAAGATGWFAADDVDPLGNLSRRQRRAIRSRRARSSGIMTQRP
jgi:hypothetical protein